MQLTQEQPTPARGQRAPRMLPWDSSLSSWGRGRQRRKGRERSTAPGRGGFHTGPACVGGGGGIDAVCEEGNTRWMHAALPCSRRRGCLAGAALTVAACCPAQPCAHATPAPLPCCPLSPTPGRAFNLQAPHEPAQLLQHLVPLPLLHSSPKEQLLGKRRLPSQHGHGGAAGGGIRLGRVRWVGGEPDGSQHVFALRHACTAATLRHRRRLPPTATPREQLGGTTARHLRLLWPA